MKYIILISLLFGFGCRNQKAGIVPGTPQGNTTYYIDNQIGNDNYNGLSPETAWKTLSKAGSVKYTSGGRILLKRGCTFRGELKLNATGRSDSPVEVSAYPENDTTLPRPVIDARGYLAGIQIINSSYLTIKNLEIISDAGECFESGALKNRYGVMAEANNGYQSKHIMLKNLYIHDIFASEQVPSGGQNPTSNMGMGIYFLSDRNASLNGIVVDGCRIEKTGHTAIKLKNNNTNPDLFIRNVKILNNSLKDIGGPGIQPGRCRNVLVKGNIVDHSGSLVDPRMHGRGSGIWPWTCDSVVIEYNRFMYAHGKMDSHGAHIDFNCNDVVIQYNLSLENGGGFVEILGNNHNCAYRYNISINDGWRVKGVDGAKQNGEILFISNYTGNNNEKKGPYNSYIYNNTIYVKSDIVSHFFLANTTDGLLVTNNIFYILGETQTSVRNGSYVPGAEIKNVIFKNNLYKYEGTIPADFPVQDSLPVYGDPGFANPGGLDPEDYIPSNTALIKDKGIPITKLPGDSIGLKIGLSVQKDFFGNDISGTPDLGAVELK